MRKVLILACAIVMVDTMLYAALTPLLPEYADDFGLSKGAAGLLVSAYGFGVLLGALPAGLAAARFGARPAVLAGLVLVSLASLGFGFASDPLTLGLARLGQGLGSSLSWAGALAWVIGRAPRERRGEVLGTALGAAVFGALLGPIVGAFAGVVGSPLAFGSLAALGGILFVAALETGGPAPESSSLGSLRGALREPLFLGGLWLVVLPSLLFGVLTVLVPLELGDAGWGTTAVGVVFLSAAALEMFLGPLAGRLSDRRGRLLPVRFGLVASALVSLVLAFAGRPALLAVLVLAASLSYGIFFAPGMALIADGADAQGLAQAVAFGVMNAAWALGNVVGPASGGGLADIAGDAVPFTILAALCLATLALSGRFRPSLGRVPSL